MASRACLNQANNRQLLGEILKGVSRSFYLSIRVLPQGMREPVAVAYLLARAADTIADTRALPPSERLERLLAFRAQVAGPSSEEAVRGVVSGIRGHQEGVFPAEIALLEDADRAFVLLECLREGDRERVRRVVETLTQGMELDLTTFPSEDSGAVVALETADELDRYTYLVAGCVGEFWTLTAMAHQRSLLRWDADRMSGMGEQFGKALQLTNVLRDVPRDLRNGRCYLPESDLAAVGLAPTDLLDPANAAQARSVLVPWIRAALGHFEAAEDYLLATPRRCIRLRLAALWPILLGLATLAILAGNEEWLRPDCPSRVRRRWVYGMMMRSVVAVPSDALLRSWIRGLRRKVERALGGA